MRKKLENALIAIAFIALALFIVKNGGAVRLGRAVRLIESEALNKRIFSKAQSFEKTESAKITLYYNAKDKAYAEFTLNNLDFFFGLLIKDFNLPEESRAVCVLYPDSLSMQNALGIAYESPPMGVYYGGVVNLLSPTEWIGESGEARIKELFLKDGPMLHELSHLALDMKTRGNYPVWLTEGAALYYENKYTGFEWRKDLAAQSARLSPELLFENFKGIDESLAYRKAYDIVAEFSDKYGEGALLKVFAFLGEGGQVAEVNEVFR